jgi:NhaA family Na+:H+ antiporter
MRTHTIAHPAFVSRRSGHAAATVFRFAVEHYLWLPLGGLIALLWANIAPESYFTFAHRLSFAVNEIAMTLFFALITQEIIEETMPRGALHTWRQWTLPVVAAAGGAAGAALAYLAYVGLKHEAVLLQGWLVATTFDIAFGYFVVKGIFRRHPAVSFLLVMAIATNAVAMIVVGLLYQPVTVRAGGVALMLAAIGTAIALRHWKIQHFWPYLLFCGPLSWWALYLEGVHPALALVPVVPFLPHQPRSVAAFADTEDTEHRLPRHFEHHWSHVVQGVLFMFALVNAGVLLHRYGTGTWALLTAALAGRPAGILAGVAIAGAAGLQLPSRLHWRELVVVSLASSAGFAFALFSAVAIYPAGPVLAELTLGAVLSGVGVVAAFIAARVLRVGRFAMTPSVQGARGIVRGRAHKFPSNTSARETSP